MQITIIADPAKPFGSYVLQHQFKEVIGSECAGLALLFIIAIAKGDLAILTAENVFLSDNAALQITR
jgi:hypothetical protein